MDVPEVDLRPGIPSRHRGPVVLARTTGEPANPEADHRLRPLLDRAGYRRREVATDDDVVLQDNEVGEVTRARKLKALLVARPRIRRVRRVQRELRRKRSEARDEGWVELATRGMGLDPYPYTLQPSAFARLLMWAWTADRRPSGERPIDCRAFETSSQSAMG